MTSLQIKAKKNCNEKLCERHHKITLKTFKKLLIKKKKLAAYLQFLVDQVAPEYLPKDEYALTTYTHIVQHIFMHKQEINYISGCFLQCQTRSQYMTS